MTFVKLPIAFLCFWIASRYYLIPDGRLRRIRIVFFLLLGLFWGGLFFQSEFTTYSKLSLRFQFSVRLIEVCFLIICCYFGWILQHQLKRIYTSILSPRVLPHVFGIRLTLKLQIAWIHPEAAFHFFGMPSTQLIGKTLASVVHPESLDEIEKVRQYLSSPQSQVAPISVQIQILSGRWFLLTAQREISDGQSESLRAGMQEVTEVKHHQQFLQILKETLDLSTQGVCLVHVDTQKILYINAFQAQMHGYTKQEIEGKPVQVLAPNLLSISMIPESTQQNARQYASLNVKKDGTVFPVWLQRRFLRQGKYRAIFCSAIPAKVPVVPQSASLVCMFSKTQTWANPSMQKMLEWPTAINTQPVTRLFTPASYHQFRCFVYQQLTTMTFLTNSGEERLLQGAFFEGVAGTFFIGAICCEREGI